MLNLKKNWAVFIFDIKDLIKIKILKGSSRLILESCIRDNDLLAVCHVVPLVT